LTFRLKETILRHLGMTSTLRRFPGDMSDPPVMKAENMPDLREIMRMLPHRYPFVLIDRIVDLVPGESIVTLKNVTEDEPFHRGHFPGVPTMPSGLMIEGMAQSGGVLAFTSLPEDMHGVPVFFMAMDNVRVMRLPFPGDQIIYTVRFLKKSSWAVKLAAVATVEGTRVCEAEIMATFGRDKGVRKNSPEAVVKREVC
jgi:3-hydroxyacyl-[acyl-carrier-protein] dehydratase